MPRRAGFTLLEVLAVVLLTSIVIGVALNHYVNLSRATERATDHTRGVRRATMLLDRVARDFESVVLFAKPAETDPLDHPWIFFGEPRRSESGADRLKFVTRGHRPRRSAAHESDLATVVYTLRASEEDEELLELMRWSSPQLPEPGSDLLRMPADESDGARLLADGLLEFGITFLDEAGEAKDSWDSTQIVDSGELPKAVQIQVAFADDLQEGDDTVRTYARTVLLRVDPLDMGELLDPSSFANGGNGEDGDGEEDEEGDDEEGSRQCRASPCAGLRACAVIGCQAKIGQFGDSTDKLLKLAIEENPEFCDWRFGISKQIRPQLIPDPACR
ncbi:MAG: type II secretion system protein GspJ [Myxococcota bacterium]|nr:type II secretion system protein GspJ [Myxococcota bacterium]